MSLVTLWFTTLAVCLLGAIIPFVNTEVYLLSASALSPSRFVPPLVVAASLGQMIGKVFLFYAGHGVRQIKSERLQRTFDAVHMRLEGKPWRARAVLFVSSTIGVPPLYVVALACGTVGMGIVPFFIIGLVGRLIHFAVVAMVPQYVKLLFR